LASDERAETARLVERRAFEARVLAKAEASLTARFAAVARETFACTKELLEDRR
jgi:hypothetical protein